MALNLRDGKGIWQQELSTYKDLTANGNRIVAVDSEDIVKAFGTATGALIWEQEDLKKRELTAPASISNLIVVGDLKVMCISLNAQNGNFEGREKISGDRLLKLFQKETIY